MSLKYCEDEKPGWEKMVQLTKRMEDLAYQTLKYTSWKNINQIYSNQRDWEIIKRNANLETK